jgi:2-polyprenyl-3-methyl-5-hydroxy-6-metoxy-1,4-benzoquinol methylase
MTYRVTDQEVIQVQTEYKKKYPPFQPFRFHGRDIHLAGRLTNILETQNGQDTDDYCIIENNKVERYMKDCRGKVLLLGTGTGREVLVAKSLGLVATGITLGSRNVHFGREYLGLSDTELIEAIVEDLPFQKETFDVVAGFQVFEHTVAPLLFLLEIGKVLKWGGKVILEWPPANDTYSMGKNPHHQVCFVPGQAKHLLMKAGFTDIQLMYDDLTPIPEDDMWKGDQKKMLVITGRKLTKSQEQFVLRAWGE